MSGIKEVQNSVVNFLGGIDKSETNQRLQNKSAVAITPLAGNAEWLKPINGKVVNPVSSDDIEPPTPEKFWVKLPGAETPKDQVSKKIRENLLTDEFSFDKKDIAAYVEKNGDKGFVIYDKTCEIWATDDEVKTWKIAEGMVEITVPKEKADELREFRVGRVLDKSLEGIEDKNLRETVKADLLKLLRAEGKDKISAAEHLLNLEVGGKDLKTVRDAIRTLSEQREARDSGVIQIVAAKMKLADTFQSQDAIQTMFDVASRKEPSFIEKVTGDLNNGGILDSNIKNNSAEIVSPMSKVRNETFQNTQVDRNRISDFKLSLERATLSAGGFDKVSGTPNPKANVNRDEAAWVNKQAADTYRAIGDTAEADKRQMIVRFYQVDTVEKKRLNKISLFDKFIPRLRVGEYAMHAPSESFKAWQELEGTVKPPTREFGEDPYKLETRQFEGESKTTETTWKGGKSSVEKSEKVFRGYERDYQIEGSVKVEGTMTSKERDFSKNKRPFPETKLIKTTRTSSRTYQSPELNPRGVVRANRIANAAGAIDEWNKWMMFIANSRKATASIAASKKAEQDYLVKNYYAVPPRPSDLTMVENKLIRSYGQRKTNEMMKFIKEASYAVWGNK